MNVFTRFKLQSIHDSIDLHRVYFDCIFVYQKFEEFSFFHEKLTYFKTNIQFIHTKLI